MPLSKNITELEVVTLVSLEYIEFCRINLVIDIWQNIQAKQVCVAQTESISRI